MMYLYEHFEVFGIENPAYEKFPWCPDDIIVKDDRIIIQKSTPVTDGEGGQVGSDVHDVQFVCYPEGTYPEDNCRIIDNWGEMIMPITRNDLHTARQWLIENYFPKK